MLTPGDLIDGKLRVARRIGRGGMGVVYEALQVHLGRRVAVKVITSHTSESEEARTRFVREARVQAQLPLEHIVQVLDIDTLPDGSLYTIMEYLEGRDLKRELTLRGPLPVAEATAYLVQACAGVSAAHAAGIVHRDLKPQNLFLTNLDGVRRVKLLDFGIAKFIQGEQELTASSVLVGTPTHLAPEQIAGGALDGRADIWALGIVLFELLTGTTPFRRETSLATLAAIANDEPPSLEQLRADVPADLAGIVRRCLEKRAADRFATAHELALALGPYAAFDGIVTPSRRAPRGSSAPPPGEDSAAAEDELGLERLLAARSPALPAISAFARARADLLATEPMPVMPVTARQVTTPPVRWATRWPWLVVVAAALALGWTLFPPRTRSAPPVARPPAGPSNTRPQPAASAQPSLADSMLTPPAPPPATIQPTTSVRPHPHRTSDGVAVRPGPTPSAASPTSAPSSPPAPVVVTGDSVPLHL